MTVGTLAFRLEICQASAGAGGSSLNKRTPGSSGIFSGIPDVCVANCSNGQGDAPELTWRDRVPAIRCYRSRAGLITAGENTPLGSDTFSRRTRTRALPDLQPSSGTVERCLACKAVRSEPWSVASLARPTGRILRNNQYLPEQFSVAMITQPAVTEN
jgi:hypothetical protein